MTNSLATAELAIYALLALPVLYLLFRHGTAGLLGWFYLFAFCSLRVVGGALSMGPSSSSASIISNVGLSPILLAASGVLHEARVHRASGLGRGLEWSFVGSFHVLVATGVALLGTGAAALQSDEPKPSDLRLVRVGIALLTASWALLALGTALSALPQGRRTASTYRDGTVLLLCVAFSEVFIGIRVFYSLVALCTGDPALNPVTGTLAVRVVLGFLSELVATLALVLGGLITRNVSASSCRAGRNKGAADGTA